LRQAFERGCERSGFRVIHFSVQGNHIHLIVEAADPQARARDEGSSESMARALNEVMHRRGPVFADRYHAHVLRTPREAAHAVRYVLENWTVHARREGWPIPRGVDPYCSAAPQDRGGAMVVEPLWWMLRVGVERLPARRCAA
jgi:hypothetical protein